MPQNERESLNPKSLLANSHLDSYIRQNYDLLSDDVKNEGYIFHIISDFLSDDSRKRFSKLSKDLSAIYPCEINIHICDDAIFSGLPRLNGNYLTYFRFFIPRFMPQNCTMCLYLDIDMLVVGDLRELFSLDMGEKCVGVVKDYILKNSLHKRTKLIAKRSDFKDIDFTGTHFNAGFLLLNLLEWRKQNISQKCFEVMANYHLDMHDQDTLNAVIVEQNRLKLPFEFNLLPRAFLQSICNDESKSFKFDYTRKQMDFALKNPVIFHFTSACPKSWQSPRIYNVQGQNISSLWWEVALKTPQFADILQGEFEKLSTNSDKENCIAIYLLKCTKNPLGFFALPFVVAKIFGKNKADFLKSQKAKYFSGKTATLQKLSPSDYNFAFELFYLCQKCWGKRKRGDLLILPLKAIKLKIRHNRYGINKINP